MAYGGILQTLKSYIDRNRLGELLVLNGQISSGELKTALKQQKKSRQPLGEVLINTGAITANRLRFELGRQMALRFIAAFILCFVSLTSFQVKKAKASKIKDLPAQVYLVNAGHGTLSNLSAQYNLFGSEEKASYNLKPFTKWIGMFERFEKDIKSRHAQHDMNQWKAELAQFKGLPLHIMAARINDMINKVPYITDDRNWSKSDYWATPVEFLERGGDCEDFAIAKYTALRALGVPEERLRVAIVHDKIKNIPHAVLAVYTDQGVYVLDNQVKNIINASHLERYRPIYSINRTAWWLHSAPQSGGSVNTVIASTQ